MKSYIGTSGYVYWHWKGIFYPRELSSYKWFDFYAKHFNTVEINSSFYRWPKETTVKEWKARARKLEKEGREFLFTLKANQMITHVKKLKGVKKLVKNFYAIAEILKPYLACILFQLPPSLKFDEKKLEDFLSSLNDSFKNVIEFRHSSWWNEKTYDLLKKYKIAFCIVSAPRLPETLVKTTDFVYVRFHGREGWYRYNYSDNELKEWAEKIKKLKAREVYCYFNNDFNAYAPANALKLASFLKDKSKGK